MGGAGPNAIGRGFGQRKRNIPDALAGVGFCTSEGGRIIAVGTIASEDVGLAVSTAAGVVGTVVESENTQTETRVAMALVAFPYSWDQGGTDSVAVVVAHRTGVVKWTADGSGTGGMGDDGAITVAVLGHSDIDDDFGDSRIAGTVVECYSAGHAAEPADMGTAWGVGGHTLPGLMGSQGGDGGGQASALVAAGRTIL